MKYIGQIFTGGWNNLNYTAEEIIDRLEKVTAIIPLEKVIIGWNTNSEIYRTVGSWLHKHGIRMLLWMPVFSETGELKEADEALDLFGKKTGNLALQEGENFTFYCPSSERNIQNISDIYEEYFSDCGFDGVFLDKIRTQSAVAGRSGIMSCCCERCEREYLQYGFDPERFRNQYEEREDLFDIEGPDSDGSLRFKDRQMEMFMEIKGIMIAASVSRICNWFRSKGLETGLDLYAPLLSRTVGQNYKRITESADFIKPMMYRKTEAPAGIGYEYNLLKQAAGNKAAGYDEIRMDEEFLRNQLQAFDHSDVMKYPGIEINYREDIARTDPEYIKESLRVCRECGMDGAVLAWDIMLAPDSHLEAVKEAEEEEH